MAFMDKFWRALLGPSAGEGTPQEALNIPARSIFNPPAPVGGLPPLQAWDYADCCYVKTRSVVAVRLKSGKRLDFCSHHYNIHADVLRPLVEAIRDERHPHEKIRPRREPPKQGPELLPV
jgi:hypothetical protein